jgi:hypothetical protein
VSSKVVRDINIPSRDLILAHNAAVIQGSRDLFGGYLKEENAQTGKQSRHFLRF